MILWPWDYPVSPQSFTNGFSIHWWPMPESIMPLIAYKSSDILSLLHLTLGVLLWKDLSLFHSTTPVLFNNFLGHRVTYESHSCKPKGCDQHTCWNNSQGKGGIGQEEWVGWERTAEGTVSLRQISGRIPKHSRALLLFRHPLYDCRSYIRKDRI